MGVSTLTRHVLRWVLATLFFVALALGTRVAAADWESGQAAYERGDIAGALQAWRPLAEAGDARAQAALGRLYIYGEGVAVDHEEALRWTLRAAEHYAYVVTMTMEERELTRALQRTRAWEKQFLRRYLSRRVQPVGPEDYLDRRSFE